jgi:hypothetical protein
LATLLNRQYEMMGSCMFARLEDISHRFFSSIEVKEITARPPILRAAMVVSAATRPGWRRIFPAVAGNQPNVSRLRRAYQQKKCR